MDEALQKASELTGWQESIRWNSWPGTTAFLQENPFFWSVFMRRENKKTWNVTQRGFSSNSDQAWAVCTGTATSCVLPTLPWCSLQVMLVVAPCSMTPGDSCHVDPAPRYLFTLSSSYLDAESCASLSHQENMGHLEWRRFSAFTKNFAMHLGIVSRVQPLQKSPRCRKKLQIHQNICSKGCRELELYWQGWQCPCVLMAVHALLSWPAWVISVLVPVTCH